MADFEPQIRFSESNSIPTRRLEDNLLLQSATTRLSPDFVYPNVTNPCYFLKTLQSDGKWHQWRTNYLNYQVLLINDVGVKVDVSSNVAQGLEFEEDVFQYELYLDLTAYEGYYKLKFLFDKDAFKPIATYETEWFEIVTSVDSSYLKFEWMNGDFYPYDDGIIWAGITQKIYLSGSDVDYMPGMEKSVTTMSNGKMKTTYAQIIDSVNVKIELAPDYIYRLLNRAIGHDYFYINSVRYNSEETFEIERQGDTRLYPSEIVLRVVEDAQGNATEDYSVNQPITGILPVIALNYRTTGLTDRTTGLTERKINN